MKTSPCGAKTRSGGACRRAPSAGRARCRLHGGSSLAGAASPSFRTGRRSKYLPDRLAAHYAEAQADPRLLELREDIALLDARLADVLQRVDSGESGAPWRRLKAAHHDFSEARRRNDTGAMRVALDDLLALIAQGHSDAAAWAEVMDLLDQRRKLVESERKRLVEMQQMITSEQAMALLGVVVDTIKRHVPDRQALSAISADLRRVIEFSPN